MTTPPLSNEKLIERLLHRVAIERGCNADVIEDLAEVDARRLYLAAGCSSLSAYCIEVLGYSEPEAYPRVAVARLAQRLPQALRMLRDGSASLSTLRLLEPHLRGERAAERLAMAAGLTVKRIDELIVTWVPKPDVPTTVKVVAAPESLGLLQRMEAPAGDTLAAEPTQLSPEELATLPPPTPTPTPLPKPLSPGKRAITFTLDEEEYIALMRLRDLDRHSTPDGDIKKIIVRAVRERLAKVEARKFGKLKREKPRGETHDAGWSDANRGGAEPHAITSRRAPSQAQRREVVARDGERCCYTSPDGRRCSSTAWLELDHTDGWALTHETRADRLRLLCRAHNQAKGSAPALVT
jgi:hypothetical protein